MDLSFSLLLIPVSLSSRHHARKYSKEMGMLCVCHCVGGCVIVWMGECMVLCVCVCCCCKGSDGFAWACIFVFALLSSFHGSVSMRMRVCVFCCV